MKYAVVNLGCKVNRVESDAFASSLDAHGAKSCDAADADLIVVNSCTVTGEAEKKTRKAVRGALRANDRATVIVTGCAAAIDKDTFLAMDPRVRVMGKAELASSIDAGAWGLDAAAHGPALPVGEGYRTRVGVKVQDGCNNACTYCVVHVARGKATSVDPREVVRQCRALASAGVKEIVLTGINLGSYRWLDEETGEATGLADLLRMLLEETADLHKEGEYPVRFRVSSVEPRDVHDDLIEVLATAGGRVCRHLHLPLQSGNSKVLREMHRPYNAEHFEAIVANLYERVPELSLSTDIICGFPGETEGEFEDTLRVACTCRFSKIHVFPYSKREGTPAAARIDQVPPGVKADRAQRLRDLGDLLRDNEREARKGTRELAVVEEEGIALTESYFEVPAPKNAKAGEMIEVTL